MGIFLSLSFSKTFRIETIITLIHSRSSLENHIPDSRPKWTKSIPSRFQTKTPQKPNPSGRHIPIWLIYGRTPRGVSSLLDQLCRGVAAVCYTEWVKLECVFVWLHLILDVGYICSQPYSIDCLKIESVIHCRHQLATGIKFKSAFLPA